MRSLFLFMLFVFNLSVSAQSYLKYSLGGSIHADLVGAFNSSSSSELYKGQTRKQYVDSTSALEQPNLTFGASIWGHKLLSKKWYIQAGISYIETGFTRVQNNVQYLDTTYPGMGQGFLLEKSAGSGEKVIRYDYRFQYLQVPVLIHYEVFTTPNFYYRISLSGGIGVNYLLKHSMHASLEQFVVDGANSFDFDSTGYTPRKLTVNFMLGAKGEYRLDKRTILYVMPVFGINGYSATAQPFSSLPYYLQLNLGVQYAFNFNEEKK